jgi:uncharacterized protein (DUF488 family)
MAGGKMFYKQLYLPVRCLTLSSYDLLMTSKEKNIWTIGHSTRSKEEFIELLGSFRINQLVDIRTYPGSSRYPHFNKEVLEEFLMNESIGYRHMAELGGRRKPQPDSINTAWRHASFRGYADHMQTAAFKNTIGFLEELASTSRLAYMCSEALWWKCHRALVSDYLKIRGWEVVHIMDVGKGIVHPYTSPAREVQGNLFY